MRAALALFAIAAPLFAQAPSLRGELRQGALVVGQASPLVRVRWRDRELRVSPQGSFLIGLGPEEPARGVLEVRVPGRPAWREELEVRPRRYGTEVLSGLPRALIDLRGALRDREQRGRASLAALRARDTDPPYFESGFALPARGRVSAEYGTHRVMNGTPQDRHFGVDLAAPLGAPVHAPADGVIVLCGELPIEGRMLVIDHGYGLTSSLLHLSRARVVMGARVHRGEIIAEVGASGRVTGPHLDWRMSLLGVPLDPLSSVR